jgi:MFS family permease
MTNFLNRGYTQVLVISVVCFCCPGFFNALSGLGGAGSMTPSTSAAANATLYFFFALFGYFGGAFYNLFGARTLMFAGGMTYAFYAMCAYLNGYHSGLNWLFIMSGGILGIGASFLWCAQGTLMLSYAPRERLGYYIATFWTIFNIGGFVGGMLQFGLNFNGSSGDASPASYFAFTGVMVAGAVVALLFLVPPSSVVKEDGTEVVIHPPKSPKEEFKDVSSVILDRNMLMLFLLFLGSNFFYTYVFNGVNGFIFNLRTRGLNSAIYWAAQMLGAIVIGKLLDNTKKSTKNRAMLGFIILAVFMNAVYAAGCYLEYGFLEGYSKSNPMYTQIDFRDNNYAFPFILFVLYGIGDSMIQAYSYWIMGAIAGTDSNICAKYTGFYKCVQSVGACVAFVLDIESFGIPYTFQFWCCWVIFVAALPTTFLVAKSLPDMDDEKIAVVE